MAHKLLEQEKLPSPLQTKVVHFISEKISDHARAHALGNRLGTDLKDTLYQDDRLRKRPGIRQALIQHAISPKQLELLAQDYTCEDLDEIFRRLCTVSLEVAVKWLKRYRFDVHQRLGSQAPTLIMTHPQADYQVLRKLGALEGETSDRPSPSSPQIS